MKHFSNIFLLIVLCLLCLFNSRSFAAEKKNILILNSYHQGYKWTDDETQGIIEGLRSFKNDKKIFIEYMGAKWVYSKQYKEHLHENYKLKYDGIRFDMIIATDNDAFDFLKQYRDEVFGRVPVVFCGINSFKIEQLKGHSLYTGVNEHVDIGKNLELMLKLHPGTRHIYVIVDMTTTGAIIRENLSDYIHRFQDRVTIHIIEDGEFSEILNRVSTLQGDSLVFLAIFQKDKSGTILEYDETASKISQKSTVPVYGVWDFYMGSGIVGGLLANGHDNGKNAAQLAVRILRGESPDSIPVIMETPNNYSFDYKQIVRFGIKRSELPDGSVVVNEPVSFYKINKGLVWGLLGGTTVLLTLVIYLLYTIRRRNLAETALISSEEKYKNLVDNLTLGVYRNTAEVNGGRLIHANPAHAKIFGYDSVDELKGLSIIDCYMDDKEREQFIEEIKRDGFVKDRVLLMKKKDGTPVWINLNSRATFTETGDVAWIDGIVEDISEKKKMEMQLYQFHKMESLGQFAGNIAHDFNIVLGGIMGYISLMKLKLQLDKEDKLNKLTDEIMKASERAVSLTMGLLAFSRKQDISVKAVKINELINKFEGFLNRIVGKDITLTVNCTREELTSMADSGQIEQVLMNIASNARDAMPKGGILSIATKLVELAPEYVKNNPALKAGKYAVISISDTGCGMDEETQLRIFEPFFTTKEAGKGTGLGMSIIYGIIKQHNGDIRVSSEVGRGTTFSIYLPLSD